MTRILVTGASGLLGLNFAMMYYRRHTVTGVVNHNSLQKAPFAFVQADLAQPEALDKLIDQAEPEVVLHCAALANIDACESQPELAWQINTLAPQRLAERAARDGFKLVHISTDAVFDGARGNYSEEDRPNPLGVYANSKLAAEEKVLAACPRALVARVNFYGWSLTGRRSLSEYFYRSFSENLPVRGFTDVFFCPLEVTQLGETLLRLVELDVQGIYHVLSRDCLSKYDFGCRIAEIFGFDPARVQPVRVLESGLVARRSPNLRMRTDKLARTLGEPAPGVAEGLQRFYRQMGDGTAETIRSLARVSQEID